MKTMIGFDIGTRQLKLAVIEENNIKNIVVANIPENFVKNGKIVSIEAMAELIKNTAIVNKIKAKKCAVALNSSEVFLRTMEMPVISVDKLKLNLPYEFRNYITAEKEKYFYDYALLDMISDEDGNQVKMNIVAAATLKSTIEDYKMMFRRAGFKLVKATPLELAYSALISHSMKFCGFPSADDVFCIVDIGHLTSRVHVYRGNKFDVTRSIDCGSAMIDAAIADEMHVDRHIAATYKENNYNNVLSSEYCYNIYHSIAIEINKTIRFYTFNHRDAEIQYAFISGGGAKIPQLADIISSMSEMQIFNIDKLIPGLSNAGVGMALAAVGAALS